MKKLDMRLEADAMHGAQQVGREHEGAFEDRDDQQVLRLGLGDSPRQRRRPLRDRLLVDQDFNFSRAAHDPSGSDAILSPGATNFTSASATPSGGASSRATKWAR